MNRSDIENIVSEAIVEIFMADGFVFSPDITAMDVDGWDSLSHVLFVAEIEKRFSIEFPGSSAFEVRNLQELVDLIGRLKA